jgi:hypothetical protein
VSSKNISTVHPFLRSVLALSVGALLFVATAHASAQGTAEAPAKALQKKAMDVDFLSTDFAKAQEKLEKAMAQCGADKCSAQLRALLRRDLAVVQISGGLDKEKGISNLVEALKIDASVALDPDLKTKELEQAFAEAKKRAAGGGASAVSSRASSSGGGRPEGDFTHTPVTEQQVRTAIPVYAEYAGEEALVRVIARYKGFGMTDWKPVELKKMGEKGWGGLLPCGDVQQGVTQYYIQGFNAENDPVAVGGDRNNPYKVQIKTDKVAEPPHLPNAAPPTQCEDTGDCPPNFPGCKKAPVGGVSVAADAVQVSEPDGKEGGEFCEENSDCKSNVCEASKCTDFVSRRNHTPRLWLGISGTYEHVFVPSAKDVCKIQAPTSPTAWNDRTPVNDSNYYCTAGASDYPSRTMPNENDRLVSGNVNGGPTVGNIRVMLTADYAILPNIMLGGRLGYVFGGYPGEEASVDGRRFSAPIHFELRTTYLFGKEPLSAVQRVVPYAFGGFGVGRFETAVPVPYKEREPAPKTPGCDARGICDKNVDAWHLAGPAFLVVGGGARFALNQRFALMGGLRMNLAFLNAFAPSIGPELGIQAGF